MRTAMMIALLVLGCDRAADEPKGPTPAQLQLQIAANHPHH